MESSVRCSHFSISMVRGGDCLTQLLIFTATTCFSYQGGSGPVPLPPLRSWFLHSGNQRAGFTCLPKSLLVHQLHKGWVLTPSMEVQAPGPQLLPALVIDSLVWTWNGLQSEDMVLVSQEPVFRSMRKDMQMREPKGQVTYFTTVFSRVSCMGVLSSVLLYWESSYLHLARLQAMCSQ